MPHANYRTHVYTTDITFPIRKESKLTGRRPIKIPSEHWDVPPYFFAGCSHFWYKNSISLATLYAQLSHQFQANAYSLSLQNRPFAEVRGHGSKLLQAK